MWERLGQTTAMALWTHLSLCGGWYPVSTRVTWGLPSAACGLPLHTGEKKSWHRGLASVGFHAKDLAAFPGAPHHILTSRHRCTYPVTHIVPCSPLGAGAATGLPPAPSPTSFSFPCGTAMAPKARPGQDGWSAGSQLRKAQGHSRVLLRPDSKSGALQAMWGRLGDPLIRGISNLLLV